MTIHVALLRAVNVCGANRLPMAEFRALLSGLGLARVATCIQSGNAVFDSDRATADLEPLIRDAIATRFGFAPDTFVRDAAGIASALTDHPFADADPARVHVCCLAADPKPDEAALRALALAGDGWHLGPRRITLHTPGGVGTSKLLDRLPRLLSAPMTARNLRTIAALHALAAAHG
ncbi:MAG: DUF1697 domain-containing protein [Tabrizicola sp.]|uniref:DUF1697 domain-containing protein n=1 Tax=Tabrizicola sp. TaxID=2005166 RepID=UPI0027343DD9|nr:DUF1697 domain-containing protein [Tabrizicola sp.]MDP3263827.1 DUF1697 domain-containing protein [Tabrizicola sp.]MDP3647191.1 DUF1697 domain-containing protein [Paracoccaceae bacterium]MDZ4067733.1 DUF1697 domain-containing protein [Tabrizicola sp.]